MRRLGPKARLVLIVALTAAGVMLAGCGSDGTTAGLPTTNPAATSPPTSVAAGTVLQLAKDVPYSSVVRERHHAPLLDVYAPQGAEALPLVVLFHGNPLALDKAGKGVVPYQEIAEAIARGGSVVVSVNWGPSDGDRPTTADAFVADAAVDESQAACAVSFAVEHASEFGADADRLVLLGHAAGAVMLSRLVLFHMPPPDPTVGCLADAAWEPSGAVLWEGDEMLADPAFDSYGPVVLWFETPWGFLDRSTFPGSVAFVVSDRSTASDEFRRCGDLSWVALRDPAGVWPMQDALTSIGALDDGCVDLREESLATAMAMREYGLDATVVAFTDPATTHNSIAQPDLDRLSGLVQQLAGS